jgi:hypothetical protein
MLLSAMVLARYSWLKEIVSGWGELRAVCQVLERPEMGLVCNNPGGTTGRETSRKHLQQLGMGL